MPLTNGRTNCSLYRIDSVINQSVCVPFVCERLCYLVFYQNYSIPSTLSHHSCLVTGWFLLPKCRHNVRWFIGVGVCPSNHKPQCHHHKNSSPESALACVQLWPHKTGFIRLSTAVWPQVSPYYHHISYYLYHHLSHHLNHHHHEWPITCKSRVACTPVPMMGNCQSPPHCGHCFRSYE